MTSQKTTLTINARRRFLFWPVWGLALLMWTIKCPLPEEWLIERMFHFHVGEYVGPLRRQWRRSALARRLDRWALRSQLAASRRIWYNRIVPADVYFFCRREEERLYDKLDATYRH